MVGSNQFKELCIMAYHGALWWFMIIHVEQKHATNIATTYHQKSNHDPASWELTLSPTKVTCEGWFSFSRWDMSVNSQFPWIFSRPSCHHLLWGRSEWHSSGSTPDSAAQRPGLRDEAHNTPGEVNNKLYNNRYHKGKVPKLRMVKKKHQWICSFSWES